MSQSLSISAQYFNYEQIQLDAIFRVRRVLTREDGDTFARLSGDYNPLHTDPEFGAKSSFGRNVAHGMLAASLFSQLIGMHCPGVHSLWLSQTLNFRSPIFFGDTIEAQITVIGKSDALQVVSLKTQVFRGSELLIDGTAKVKVLSEGLV